MTLRNSNKLLCLIATVYTLMLAGCGSPSLTGGSTGTEVSAAVGTVLDRNGKPIENAVVRLRPADFLTDSARSLSYAASHSILDTFTGTDGGFIFTNLVPDSYLVEIVEGDTLGALAELRIGSGHDQVKLPPIIVAPLAQLTGNVQINYGNSAFVFVQVFGLDRSAKPDDAGNFFLMVPSGNRRLHIGAYRTDSLRTGEFDGRDISFEVFPGEQQDAGSFRLKPTPPPPCIDGSCDSSAVRSLLDVAGKSAITLASVTIVENGRIVELNLRGINLAGIMPFDINRLAELRVLDLGQTGLMCIFPDMGRMTKLEVVRLDGNSLPFFASMAGNLERLRELDLSGNELTGLPPTIVNCTNISFLYVSNNRLCSIDAATAAWIDRYDTAWRTNQRCQ